MISCTFEDGVTVKLRHVVVTALSVRENKILLVKRADFLLEGGKYGIPGGFLDENENLTEGLLREFTEETGLEGHVASLFRINSDPGRAGEDRQNVDIVFLVEAGRKISEPDREVAEVAWFDLNELPSPDKIAFDHAEIIELFKKYQQEQFSLPLLD